MTDQDVPDLVEFCTEHDASLDYNRRHVCWHQRIPPEHLAALEDLREAYANGKLRKRWTPRALYDLARQRGLDVPVSYETFRKWLTLGR